ncbi:hypothetical protein KXX12_008609, partial [Aspergillus fumigatus]
AAVPMRFSPDSAVGVPWADAEEARLVPTYRNRGTVSLRVTLGRDGAQMCSALPPGESGFVAPDGKTNGHYADQMELFSNFTCKRDVVGAIMPAASVERVERLEDRR